MGLQRMRRASVVPGAVGAGCYWGASLLAVAPQLHSAGSVSDPGSELVPVGTALALVLVGCALADHLRCATLQKLLMAGGMGTALAKVALACAGVLVQPGFFTAYLLCEGVQMACCVLFWGLWFASLNKSLAEKATFLALSVCFLVYLAFVGTAEGGWSVALIATLKALSFVPCVIGCGLLPTVHREPRALRMPRFAPKVLTRVVLGIGSGVCMGLMSFRPVVPVTSRGFLCLALFGALAAALAALMRRASVSAGILRTAPLLVVGLLVAPYLGSGREFEVLLRFASIAVWITWIVLTSIQLSQLKETLGWGDARIAFADKAIYVTSWALSWSLTYLVVRSLGEETLQAAISYTVPGVLYAAVVIGCACLGSLVDDRVWAHSVRAAARLFDERSEAVIGRVAADFGLTERERTIMGYIAQGYTRPHICAALTLADSTVKSHTKHLYQKLSVHSKDELLALVETYRRPERPD